MPVPRCHGWVADHGRGCDHVSSTARDVSSMGRNRANHCKLPPLRRQVLYARLTLRSWYPLMARNGFAATMRWWSARASRGAQRNSSTRNLWRTAIRHIDKRRRHPRVVPNECFDCQPFEGLSSPSTSLRLKQWRFARTIPMRCNPGHVAWSVCRKCPSGLEERRAVQASRAARNASPTQPRRCALFGSLGRVDALGWRTFRSA